VQQLELLANPSTAPDLRAIYAQLHDTLPWPRPIPPSESVRLKWKARHSRVLGSCRPKSELIKVNRIYQDERLHQELPDLMAHEMAHFIWPNHGPEFKAFLRRAGISSSYMHSRSDPSATLWLVLMGHEPDAYLWQCPACLAVRDTGYRVTASCGRCAPRWDRRYVLKRIRMNEITSPVRLTTLRPVQ